MLRGTIVRAAAATMLGLGVVLGAPGAGLTQKTTLPDFMLRISRDPAVISGQLRMAAELGRKALAAFQVDDGSSPLDGPVQLSRDTYVLIRAARTGLDQMRSQTRFGDPIADYAHKRITEAWNLARTPAERITWGHSRQEYLAISLRDLSQAVTIVEEVLVVLP